MRKSGGSGKPTQPDPKPKRKAAVTKKSGGTGNTRPPPNPPKP